MAPGDAASSGCGPLGVVPIRQRVAVAPEAGVAGAVSSRHGVALAAVARLKRRADVRSTPSRPPIASATALERKASPSTHSVSLARRVSTTMTSVGAMPSRTSPGQ